LDITQLSNLAQPILEDFARAHSDLLYSNLATEDGFVLGHVIGHRSQAESDKVSALASTLFSLAESSSEDVSADRLNVLIMDSRNSCGVVMRSALRSKPVILSMAMDGTVSLGHILYHANRIAEQLRSS